MSDAAESIDALRERLSALWSDWGAQMNAALDELERHRRELEGSRASRDGEVEGLNRQLRGQAELIETLRGEAAEASALRQDLQAMEVELSSLKSERDSKQELIRALRRDAEQVDRLKGDVRGRDREVADLRRDNEALKAEVERLRQTVGSLREAAESEADEGAAELESMRAELEARKRLIKSLQGDAERVQGLEERLDEKRQVIQSLEASINRHADTIAELKRSTDAWKRKYRTLKGVDATSTTSVELPALQATDVRGSEPNLPDFDERADRTIAIDMRQSLIEARRTSQGRGVK